MTANAIGCGDRVCLMLCKLLFVSYHPQDRLIRRLRQEIPPPLLLSRLVGVPGGNI